MSKPLNLKELVCKNIKKKRLEAGISQTKLSAATRLTVHYLSKLERRAQNLTLDTVEDIATALNITVGELILGDDARLPKPSKKVLEAVDQVIWLLQAYRADM